MSELPVRVNVRNCHRQSPLCIYCSATAVHIYTVYIYTVYIYIYAVHVERHIYAAVEHLSAHFLSFPVKILLTFQSLSWKTHSQGVSIPFSLTSRDPSQENTSFRVTRCALKTFCAFLFIHFISYIIESLFYGSMFNIYSILVHIYCNFLIHNPNLKKSTFYIPCTHTNS